MGRTIGTFAATLRAPSRTGTGRPRRYAVTTTLVAVLALVFQAGAFASPDASAGGERVRAIVVLHDGVDPHATAVEMERRHDGDVDLVFDTALNGFAGVFPQGRLGAIERDPRVVDVELDQLAHTFAQEVPTGVQRIFADENEEIGIDGTDDHRVDVDVAVIDTGIDLDHPDLHVVASTDCSGGSPLTGSCGDGGDDDNGHGTHVAGTIGAIDDGTGVVGVAPGARLAAVKVLRSDGSGYISWIVAGIDWVTERAHEIEVANMSLGCECSSDALDTAIANSVAAGVAYAVAAGNSSSDVSTFSPANHPDVLTVSALADFDGAPGGEGQPTCRDDEDDTFADFSNFGDEVEVIAPGVCIRSTWNDGGYRTISGTSMASPHAAGALGLLASGTDAPTSGSDVKSLYGTVQDSGNDGWDPSDDPDEVQEPLLDVGDATVYDPALVAGGDDDGGNTAPTASFTHTCTDLSCEFDGSDSSDPDGTIASHDWDLGDGSTASGETVTHTYESPGDYTVTLTVTDDEGATGTDSQVVSVSDGDGDGTTTAVHIHSLTGNSINHGSTWTAEVTVFVHDGDGAVEGETVSFDYVSERGTVDGSDSCTTDADGNCTVPVDGIPKRDGSITFTATEQSTVSLADSHETQITVSKP